METFFSEEDLKNFDGWLKYQCVDASGLPSEELEAWRSDYYEKRAITASFSPVGKMALKSNPNEHKYAVALRDGSDLWLAIWVKHTPKGEFFVFVPTLDQDWDLHASYHLDGTVHVKSRGSKVLSPNKRQPLTGVFKGSENLLTFGGYAPKSVGAVCDPAAFAGILEIGPGILGPRNGMISVDLVAPGCDAINHFTALVKRQVFRDVTPWVVLSIWSTD